MEADALDAQRLLSGTSVAHEIPSDTRMRFDS
jgi:hypothetical protein